LFICNIYKQYYTTSERTDLEVNSLFVVIPVTVEVDVDDPTSPSSLLIYIHHEKIKHFCY